jgi:dihydroxyacetone kinase-like protein
VAGGAFSTRPITSGKEKTMAMKKFINKPENIAKELIRGLVKAHPHYLELVGEDLIVRRKKKEKGKVQLVFAQGIGHEPGWNGMVGYGMTDVSVPGDIFACAGGDRIYEGIKFAWETGGHAPVLLIIANHEGDVLNGNMGLDLAKDDGIDVESVLLYDDIASAPKGQEEKRRGLAGMQFSIKIAGAMAEQGKDRAAIMKKVRQVNASTRTILVALRPCTLPTTGQLLFELGEDEMIIGPGQHGEAGPEGPAKLATANRVIDEIAQRLIDDGGYGKGDDLLVLINNTGATTLMEMFIMYDHLEDFLKGKGISVYKPLIGDIITTQEMAGIQLSLCRADGETKSLWDFPADTPYYRVTGGPL